MQKNARKSYYRLMRFVKTIMDTSLKMYPREVKRDRRSHVDLSEPDSVSNHLKGKIILVIAVCYFLLKGREGTD